MFFGLTQKIKTALVRHEAHEKGEEFAKEGGSMFDWLRSHKTQIGIGFGILSGAFYASPWKDKATPILNIVSSFLIGAGILTSDQHAAEGK